MADEQSPEDPHNILPEKHREEQLSTTPENAPSPSREEDEKDQMPFLDHLEELRWRLLKSLATVLVGAVICFVFVEELMNILTAPYEDAVWSLETSHSPGFIQAVQKLLGEWAGEAEGTTPDQKGPLPEGRRLLAIKVMTLFFVRLQIALMGGLVLTLPVVFYHAWRFVAPGLLAQERRLVLPIVALSVFCFCVGAAIAYWIVLPLGLRFFLALEPANMTSQWAVDEYIGFVLRLIMGFGIVFEMPVLALFLSRLGLLTPDYLRRVRRYAIIATFILAAIFTPPDPLSQIMMALPLLALYEISIWVSKVSAPKDV